MFMVGFIKLNEVVKMMFVLFSVIWVMVCFVFGFFGMFFW